MKAVIRALIEADDGAGLERCILVEYGRQSLSTLYLTIPPGRRNRKHRGIRIFDCAVWMGALQCIQIGLTYNLCDLNVPDKHGRVTLHYLHDRVGEIFPLLLQFGANPRVQDPPNHHSLLFLHAVMPSHPYTPIVKWLLFGGVRLNQKDKDAELSRDDQVQARAAVLEAEHILALRVAQCRRTCIAIIRAMPGPRDCTKDWVRRFLWPMRHCQAWMPGTRLPYFLQREDEI